MATFQGLGRPSIRSDERSDPYKALKLQAPSLEPESFSPPPFAGLGFKA